MFNNAEASCLGVNTDLFFIDERSMNYDDKRYLIKLCSNCPVYSKCRQHSIEHLVDGWWAGTTFSERKRIRKASKIAGIPVTLHISDLAPSQNPKAIERRKLRAKKKEEK